MWLCQPNKRQFRNIFLLKTRLNDTVFLQTSTTKLTELKWVQIFLGIFFPFLVFVVVMVVFWWSLACLLACLLACSSKQKMEKKSKKEDHDKSADPDNRPHRIMIQKNTSLLYQPLFDMNFLAIFSVSRLYGKKCYLTVGWWTIHI